MPTKPASLNHFVFQELDRQAIPCLVQEGKCKWELENFVPSSFPQLFVRYFVLDAELEGLRAPSHGADSFGEAGRDYTSIAIREFESVRKPVTSPKRIARH